MRLVLDTSAIVAAMRSPSGASAALLRAARASKIVLLANVALALEYEATCRLADHRLAAGLDMQVRIFIDAVLAMMEPVESYFIGGRSCAILVMNWCSKLLLTTKPRQS